MPASTFKNNVSITHIGTATAVINIDGIMFLTDPFFSPAGSEWDTVPGAPKLRVHHDPALKMDQLPPIDAVLLSHENHPDNLDELGRQLLDGRHVFTTKDGAKNLSPRPGVLGFDDWEEKDVVIAGTTFHITATPCKHWPGHECNGFVLHTESFGISIDGKPNAIYFSGDTVYIEELAKIADRYHIAVAIMNCGQATVENFDAEGQPSQTGESLQITMSGHQAAHIFRDIKADVLVPMHYDAWDHFKQKEEGLSAEFREEGIMSRVRWLQPGKAVLIDSST